MPWAFIGAVVLVIAFECVLRASGWPRVVPYQMGLDEYHAVRTTLDTQAVPEVVFVGSSRTRESIHLPTLRETLQARLGREVSVANYGLSRARAFDFEAIIRRLLREPTPPRLIFMGIGERDLAPGTDQSFDQGAYFWTFADWQRARRAHPTQQAGEWLSIVARISIGDVWRTLGLRESMQLGLRQRLFGIPTDGRFSPIRGEASVWQSTQRRKSMADRPPSDEQIRGYVATLNLDRFPDADMLTSFDSALKACRDAGVTLVVYEVPVSQPFKNFCPPGLSDAFLTLVQQRCDAHQTPFIRSDTLGLNLGRFHFREQSHMNWRGAQGFSRNFGEQVIAPRLKASAR